MGVVVTNRKDLYTQLRFIQNGVGAVPSPFDCFLAHRGLKTLHLRMEASARYVRRRRRPCCCCCYSLTIVCFRDTHDKSIMFFGLNSNAYAIALFLEGHPAVGRVVYPGLPSHPQHELAKRQQHGFGSMITFYCQGGRDQSAVILQNVRRPTMH